MRVVTLRVLKDGIDNLEMIYMEAWKFTGFTPEMATENNDNYMKMTLEALAPQPEFLE